METIDNLRIRRATPDDAKELVRIYAYYVKNTAISFEYDVPSIDEFRERIINISSKFPYLVAEQQTALFGNNILGYAYANAFKPRAAYSHSVELSIYVNNKLHGKGLGGKLYRSLIHELSEQGYHNLYACVAYPTEDNEETDDEYLPPDSVKFHEHFGFEIVGRLHKCGRKFGKLYDMVYMEKLI